MFVCYIANSHLTRMKRFLKIFRRIMLGMLSVVLLLVVAGLLFLAFAPQIGASASGERLDRMQQSPNFADGIFQNTIETTMDLPASAMPGLIWKMLTGVKGQEPLKQIKTLPFTPEIYGPLPDSQTAVTWFGHSTMMLKLEGKTFLFDPVFSPRASMFSFMGPKQFNFDKYIQVEDLPQVDAVVISHDHYDHLDYETVQKLTAKVGHFFVPLGVGAHLEAWGVAPDNISEMDWWNETEFQGLTVAFTPSRHFSGRGVTNRNTTLWGSWVVMGKTQRIYFSGDSGYTPEFANIGEKYGPFDLAFVECGQYNPQWASIHMMPEETAQAAMDLQADLMIPIHWGKFALSLHTWEDPVARMTVEADRIGQSYLLPQIFETIILGKDAPKTRWWEAFL